MSGTDLDRILAAQGGGVPVAALGGTYDLASPIAGAAGGAAQGGAPNATGFGDKQASSFGDFVDKMGHAMLTGGGLMASAFSGPAAPAMFGASLATSLATGKDPTTMNAASAIFGGIKDAFGGMMSDESQNAAGAQANANVGGTAGVDAAVGGGQASGGAPGGGAPGGAAGPAGPSFLANGGVVRGGPKGTSAPIYGMVRGGEPGVDKVDAMLSEGSYVIPRHAIDRLGQGPSEHLEALFGPAGESSGDSVHAHVSGGEYVMSPAQVERAGGSEVLDRRFGVQSDPDREAFQQGGEVAPPPAAMPDAPSAPPSVDPPAADPQLGPVPTRHGLGSLFSIPMIRDPAQAEELPAGTKFRTPDGKERVRPYDVADDAGYQEVPQGGWYREGGQLRQKPTSDGGVNPVAQTLYDMAKTPEGRKEALSFIYGSDAIEHDRGEYYVVTADGKRLSPKAKNIGALVSRGIGGVASGALPGAGGALGAAGGAALGAAGGPGGAIAGGVAGGGAGAAAGELGNQQILQGLGIEKLPPGERATEAGISGAVGAAGSALATAIPAIPAMLRAGAHKVGDALPGMVSRFVGATPEATKLAGEIAGEGGRVPLQSYAPEAPFIRYIMQWAKQFGYDPVGKAAKETWYPAMSSELLGALGVPEAERGVVGRTSAVSLEPAGEAATAKVRQQMKERTQSLMETVQSSRRARELAASDPARAEARDIATEQTALVTQADKLREAADSAVKQGVTDLQREVDAALKRTDAKPGDLSRWFAGVIDKARVALSTTAKPMYAAADELAAGHAPNITPLTQHAKSIVDEIPDALRLEFPREIEILSKLSGKASEAPKPSGLLDQFGTPIKAAEAETKDVTFGDLHQLRNFLRAKVDWGNLTMGPKQGSLVRLSRELDGVINDAEAVPELKAASDQLRKADDFWRDNIRKFEDETVRAIAKFGRSATADDAEKLAGLTLRDGNTERIRLLRDMGGDDLWNHVVAADTRAMLNEAGAKAGAVDSQKFAEQIGDRARSGVLAEAYPKEMVERLQNQANRIARSYGKMPPLETRPGDSVFTMLDRAEAHIARAESLAERDPMGMLKKEMQGIRDKSAQDLRAGRSEIEQNPLRSVTTLGAEAAAKKILGSADLIAEAEKQFGANSPEFTMLRQVYARQLVQDMADATIPAAGRKAGGLGAVSEGFMNLSPETQARLFPGVTRDQMSGMIRKMVMMFPNEGGDFGSNLSGAALVTHPGSASSLGLPGAARKIMGAIPTFGARFVISKILDKASSLASSPQLIAFIARGLEGTPRERSVAEGLLAQLMDTTPQRAAVGAAGASYGERATGDQAPPPAAPETAPEQGWRTRVQPAAPTGWRTRVQ